MRWNFILNCITINFHLLLSLIKICPLKIITSHQFLILITTIRYLLYGLHVDKFYRQSLRLRLHTRICINMHGNVYGIISLIMHFIDMPIDVIKKNNNNNTVDVGPIYKLRASSTTPTTRISFYRVFQRNICLHQ